MENIKSEQQHLSGLRLSFTIEGLFISSPSGSSVGGLLKALEEYAEGRFTYNAKEAAAFILTNVSFK